MNKEFFRGEVDNINKHPTVKPPNYNEYTYTIPHEAVVFAEKHTMTELLWMPLDKRPVIYKRPEGENPITVTAAEVLREANGHTIVVGETHSDRESLHATLALMHKAHTQGYRILGVEIADHDSPHPINSKTNAHHPGLKTEIQYITSRGLNRQLTEFDRSSSNAPAANGWPTRANRQFQIQLALQLGWEVRAIDPYFWSWQKPDEERTQNDYLELREPAVIEHLRKQKDGMVAAVGYTHLGGIAGQDDIRESGIVMVNSARLDKVLLQETDEFNRRDTFAATQVPLLRG